MAKRLCIFKGALVAASVIAGAAIITASTAFAFGLRVNNTASQPIGVWRLTDDPAGERGAAVWACPPNNEAVRMALRYGSLPPGICPVGSKAILKVVGAVAGDQVEVTDAGVAVNGRLLPNTKPLDQDGLGRPLPRVQRGKGKVRPGEVWLLSTYNAASFDSRYFGPVTVDHLKSRAEPLWIWEE